MKRAQATLYVGADERSRLAASVHSATVLSRPVTRGKYAENADSGRNGYKVQGDHFNAVFRALNEGDATDRHK